MFSQVEEINRKWIAEKESLLADAQVLVAQLNRKSGVKMQKCIDALTILDTSKKNAIYKDPNFLNWLAKLNNEIIQAYENQNETWKEKTLIKGVNLIFLAISNLIKKDYAFLFLPQSEGIKIINKKIELFLNEGGEYDVQFDFSIDEKKWLSTLGEALKLIKLDKISYQLVKNFVSYIIPLKQKAVIQNLSFSSRNLPNVIFKNNEESPYLFGETLVHEADHHFFYALENFYSVWNLEVKFQKAIYRSPWRDDARPLDGIIRGLSAFVRVSNYYSNVIIEIDSEERNKVGELLLKRIVQCEDAMETLINSNQLSDFGKEYVLEMKNVLQQADDKAKQFAQYEYWRAVAIRMINDQRKNWDKTQN